MSNGALRAQLLLEKKKISISKRQPKLFDYLKELLFYQETKKSFDIKKVFQLKFVRECTSIFPLFNFGQPNLKLIRQLKSLICPGNNLIGHSLPFL